MKFCEKLIILRKRRGMTQEEFSRAVGVSRQSVYKWESGQSYPEAEKLLQIRKLYGVSIDHLLDETEALAFPEERRTERLHASYFGEASAQVKSDEKKTSAAETTHTPSPTPRVAAEETSASVRVAPKTPPPQPPRVSGSDYKRKKKQNPLIELVGSIFGKRR